MIIRQSLVLDGLRWGFARLFQQIFPADCAICQEPLQNISRIPVCPSCLDAPQPLVAEHACQQCQTAFLNDFPLRPDGICPLCRTGETYFDRVYSYGSYDQSLARLLHLFKYGRIKTLAEPLARMMVRGLPSQEQFDLVVPMPLHWKKQLLRGFNQSELLSREIGPRLGVPVIPALKRIRSTDVQAGLTLSQRRKNVQGAFQVSDTNIQGKKILLIDDVLTTGATVSAAAKVLRKQGTARITVLTLARVDRRMPSMLVSYPTSSHQTKAVSSGVF